MSTAPLSKPDVSILLPTAACGQGCLWTWLNTKIMKLLYNFVFVCITDFMSFTDDNIMLQYQSSDSKLYPLVLVDTLFPAMEIDSESLKLATVSAVHRLCIFYSFYQKGHILS